MSLATGWGLELGHAFPGGTAAYVVSALDESGRACVLKVAMPLEIDGDDTFANSVIAHRLAAGVGCAELFAHDPSVPAMLLERLGPNLADLGLPVERILETVASTLRQFWRPVPDDCGLPSGSDKARWLAAYITTTWDALGRPFERAIVDRALDCCERRTAAFDESCAVLVHGDAHGWNTLDAGGGTFKFVDPEGLRSTREHDLSVAMREYNEPLLAGDTRWLTNHRAEWLAEVCEVDPVAVWEWGYVERVSTGLANLHDFGPAHSAAFFEVARRCL